MPYIGQNLQVAYPTYKNIDDISGSFNGSTTSFALLVSGAAPVPLPLNSQQCLISVGGVIQRPDDTGSEGFRLSGGNIVFSSAPSTGEDFFGIILAGADYVNVGANFPDGSVGVPSITFEQDSDTGFYRSGSGIVSFSSNSVQTAILGSNSLTAPSFIPTSSTVPTNGVYLPAANSVGISTNSTERLRINSSGNVGIGTSSPGATLDVSGNTKTSTLQLGTNPAGVSIGVLGIPNQKRIYGRNTANSADINIAYINGSDGMVFGPGDAAVIDSSGRLGIGTTSPSAQLHVQSSAGSGVIKLGDSSNTYIARLQANAGDGSVNLFNEANYALTFGTNNTERARIDSSGRLLVGTSSSTGANVKGVFGAGLASSDAVLVVNTNDQAIYAIAISNWDGATTTNGAKMAFSNSGIGDFIIGAGSGINRFEVFNGAGTGVFLTSGNTSWTSTSDERLKTDLAPIENAIDRVNSLRAVTGRFNTDEEGVSRGFLIAQDVQLVFPEAVDNSNPDELGVRYTEVIPLLVAALKESKERIEALEAKVAALETA